MRDVVFMGSVGGFSIGRVVWQLLLGAGARLHGSGACLVCELGWVWGLPWFVGLLAEGPCRGKGQGQGKGLSSAELSWAGL